MVQQGTVCFGQPAAAFLQVAGLQRQSGKDEEQLRLPQAERCISPHNIELLWGPHITHGVPDLMH